MGHNGIPACGIFVARQRRCGIGGDLGSCRATHTPRRWRFRVCPAAARSLVSGSDFAYPSPDEAVGAPNHQWRARQGDPVRRRMRAVLARRDVRHRARFGRDVPVCRGPGALRSGAGAAAGHRSRAPGDQRGDPRRPGLFQVRCGDRGAALLPRWSWVRVLRFVPRRLRHAAYDFIARNRYHWFGRTDHCLLPTPDLARHFLAGDKTPG